MNIDPVIERWPEYKCSGIVRALKISEINRSVNGTAVLFFNPPLRSPYFVPKSYLDDCQPVAGGYYVVYVDSPRSFVAAEVFEAIYVKIESSDITRAPGPRRIPVHTGLRPLNS